MHVEIIRKKKSLEYRRDSYAPFGWHNNDANNALDDYTLFADDGSLLLACRVQTVANLEGLDLGVSFLDTIAPGEFQLIFGVEKREFRCQPLGIIYATTLKGEKIQADSTTITNSLRWLEHDRQNKNGHDTRVAWSAGCIVHADDSDLVRINEILKLNGFRPGQALKASLREED